MKPEIDNEEFVKNFSSKIRELEKNFSNRQEAADAIGVGKSTLQAWADGVREPSLSAMARLCKITGKSMDWFVSDKEDAVSESVLSEGEGVNVPVLPPLMSPEDEGTIADYVERTVTLDAALLRDVLGHDDVSKAASFRVVSDEMAPAINPIDLVIIDTALTALTANGVYAMQWMNMVTIKRLVVTPDGVLSTHDNDNYPDLPLSLDDIQNKITVFGRVKGVVKKQ